jgi:hypothetical protein
VDLRGRGVPEVEGEVPREGGEEAAAPAQLGAVGVGLSLPEHGGDQGARQVDLGGERSGLVGGVPGGVVLPGCVQVPGGQRAARRTLGLQGELN